MKGIDPHRYRKLRRFILGVLWHAFLHDVVLSRPLLRRVRRPALERWPAIAGRYRGLAIEMGGVLIKLGQFLSARVDVLPREITQVLAGLQDEVPPAPFAEIEGAIEAQFGRPVGEVFAELSPETLGAASLAQVHGARLAGGERVVVKVLRPDIEVLVETDLAALEVAIRWLRLWKAVRRRVDLKRMLREFAQTTRRELDLEAEGRNAERFAENFAADPRLRAPRIHWPESGRRVLTMEDVGFIKIADLEALDRAGVDRARLASRLHRAYMEQIFLHNFVHADPHPGNLFVRPVAGGGGEEGVDFELVFVDFGMMAEIPQRLRRALRELLIGAGSKDARRMIHAFQEAGVLLPGADLNRLEEVHEDLFERLWGVRLGEMRDVALSEARYFLSEYWDLLSDVPFQAPTELLFVGRAVGLLGGLATSVDPDFDPWAEMIPFAERLASGELGADGGLVREVVEQGRLVLRLPVRADRYLSAAERGDLTVRASLAPDAEQAVRKLHRGVRRLAWVTAAAALLVSGVLLALGRPETWWGPAALAAAGACFLWSLVPRS